MISDYKGCWKYCPGSQGSLVEEIPGALPEDRNFLWMKRLSLFFLLHLASGESFSRRVHCTKLYTCLFSCLEQNVLSLVRFQLSYHVLLLLKQQNRNLVTPAASILCVLVILFFHSSFIVYVRRCTHEFVYQITWLLSNFFSLPDAWIFCRNKLLYLFTKFPCDGLYRQLKSNLYINMKIIYRKNDYKAKWFSIYIWLKQFE